jgi:hypothetical protein
VFGFSVIVRAEARTYLRGKSRSKYNDNYRSFPFGKLRVGMTRLVAVLEDDKVGNGMVAG